MTQTPRNLLSLWDYGWCEHERLALPRCQSPQEFIGAYRHSDAFGTSFVGPESPHTPELHGPFPSSSIYESDFELVAPQRFHGLIAAIPQTSGFTQPPSSDQWQAVQRLASEVSGRHTWLFSLRLTEDDQSRFHDWGFVLTIFREFICASPDTEFAERLVFGYD
jgi:hypothetical protein